jgi:hypothetical protein
MRIAMLFLLLLVPVSTLAAPAPFPKPIKPAAKGPFEIDFTPFDALPPGDHKWRLTIKITDSSR